MDLPRTCVIGAGSSGIAAAKALHERGLPFDCLEASDGVGDNWERHTIQVDVDEYPADLAQERRAGAARARAAGFTLPVGPRAGAEARA